MISCILGYSSYTTCSSLQSKIKSDIIQRFIILYSPYIPMHLFILNKVINYCLKKTIE